MRSVPIIALALCATSALAQTASLTEAQKRRLHVPYVRAATNCIAAAAQNDSEFANAVKTDYFQPLISRGWEACKQQLTAMVQAHDQIYGGGGLEFAKGAYSNDLERAVRKVLATDIATERATLAREEDDRKAADARAAAERMEAEAKAREAEAKARQGQAENVALLEKSRDLIRDKVFACIGREGASMVLTDEKAGVVAKASMIFCQADVDALIRSSIEIAETQYGAPSNPQALRDAIEKSVLDVVSAYVVKARGELIQKNLKPAPTPEQQSGPPA